MPLIYGTDQLHEMSRKLRTRYPDHDVILLKNSVMVYAFDASARELYRANYPGQKPRNRINLSAADIQTTIDRLAARGLSVALCDLDAPHPDEGTTLR